MPKIASKGILNGYCKNRPCRASTSPDPSCPRFLCGLSFCGNFRGLHCANCPKATRALQTLPRPLDHHRNLPGLPPNFLRPRNRPNMVFYIIGETSRAAGLDNSLVANIGLWFGFPLFRVLNMKVLTLWLRLVPKRWRQVILCKIFSMSFYDFAWWLTILVFNRIITPELTVDAY